MAEATKRFVYVKPGTSWVKGSPAVYYTTVEEYNTAKGTSLDSTAFTALTQDQRLKSAATTSEQETKYANSIVFIAATSEIYTHGKYFGFTDEEAERITDLESAVAALQASSYFKGIADANGSPVYFATKDAGVIKFTGEGTTSVTVDGNGVKVTGEAHHQAKNVVSNTAEGKANAATATDGNGVYVNLVENDTVRSSQKIEGAGSVKVTSDASGNITVSGDVDTLETGATNGTVKFNGTEVSVAGLDGAAYKSEDYYFTSSAAETLQEQIDDIKDDVEDLQDALADEGSRIKALEDDLGKASSAKVLYTYEEYKTLDGNSEVTEEQFNALSEASKIKTAASNATGLHAEVEAKVASVRGENAIVVDSSTPTSPKVSLKIAEGEGKVGNVVLSQSADGLKASVSLDAQTVTMVTNNDSQYAGSYTFYQGDSSNAANAIGTINIAKDMVVSSGTVVTYTADTLPEGDGAPTAAGTYIVLTLANATNDKVYVPAASLIEYVTSGSQATDQVVVTIDENTHKVTAAITASSITETELNDSINASLDLADSAIQSVKIGNQTLSKTTGENGNSGALEFNTDTLKADLGLTGDGSISARLEAVEGAAETAQETAESKVNSVGNGTDGDFVTTTINTDDNKDVTIGVAVTTATIASQEPQTPAEGQEATTPADGLVKASDAYAVTKSLSSDISGLDTRLQAIEDVYSDWEEL